MADFVTNPVPILRGLGMNFLMRGSGASEPVEIGPSVGYYEVIDVVDGDSYLYAVDDVDCGGVDRLGEEGGEIAGDVQDGLAVDGDGLKLACGEQRVDDVTYARTSRQRGEEGLDLGLGGYDGLAEVEGDERGEGAGLPALAPALSCLVKRALVSSQRVGAPSCWGMGRTRRCCQSSVRARRTAASVTSLPSSVASTEAARPGVAPLALSARRV